MRCIHIHISMRHAPHTHAPFTHTHHTHLASHNGTFHLCPCAPRAIPIPHRLTAPHHAHLTTIQHVHNSHPQPQQLNKRLDEMTAALACTPSASQNRPPQSRSRSNRYQPYNAGPATDTTSHPSNDTACNTRTASASRKGKVGHTSPGTNDQNFIVATDTCELSACAICLSRNPHDVTQCNANLLWDGHTPAFAQKGDKGAKL